MPPRISPAGGRIDRRTLLATLAALPALKLAAGSVLAQTMPEGLVATVSATADDGVSNSLLIRITLDNRSGADLAGLAVRGATPPGTRVTESWLGRPGGDAAAPESGGLAWRGLAIAAGERLGPFAYRLVPETPAAGDAAFRAVTLQPAVAWTQPRPGTAPVAALPLAGLWGEVGLRRTVLPSLLTVMTRERPETSSVALAVSVRAGSRDETAATRGGSHWLEHAYFLGTATRPDNQAIFSEISRVGGEINATTGSEVTSYFTIVPAESFDLALDVVSDQFTASTFLPEAFERERKVVFEELRTRTDSPVIRAYDEFLGLVFRTSPLGQTPGGTIESVQNIPVETILAYGAERYVSGNITVAAVGRLRHDEAVTKIGAAFARLPRGPRAPRPRTPEPPQRDMRRIAIGEGARTATIILGWPGPGLDSDDWAAMRVIDELLGTTGLRLEEALVDRQPLASSVDASFTDYTDAGFLAVFATTRPDAVDAVIDGILTEVRRLRDGDVSQAEITAMARAIVGRAEVGRDENLRQAITFAANDARGLIQSIDETQARLRALTPVDVQRVANLYLNPDAYTAVVVRS